MTNQNKRGDVAITVLVMLVLALAVSTLTMMYFADRKIKSEFKSPDSVLNLYAEKETLRLYLYETLKQSIAESYNNAAKSQSYITPVCEQADGKKVFCGASGDWKGNIETETRIKFSEKFDFAMLKEKLREKSIEIEFSLSELAVRLDDNFGMQTKNITFTFSQKAQSGKREIVLRHVFNISDKISFESIGLADFNAVYNKANECKSQNFRECMKIEGFDAVIEEKKITEKDYYEIKMTSKQAFFLDNAVKPVELSFLISR